MHTWLNIGYVRVSASIQWSPLPTICTIQTRVAQRRSCSFRIRYLHFGR